MNIKSLLDKGAITVGKGGREGVCNHHLLKHWACCRKGVRFLYDTSSRGGTARPSAAHACRAQLGDPHQGDHHEHFGAQSSTETTPWCLGSVRGGPNEEPAFLRHSSSHPHSPCARQASGNHLKPGVGNEVQSWTQM